MFIPVFVYGTLKSGYPNSYLLKDSLFIGPYQTEPDYTLIDLGNFPAAVDSGSSSIRGEVYLVNQDVFNDLDMLEGYPSLYDRKLVKISPIGKPMQGYENDPSMAWMYFMTPKDLSNDELKFKIDSGIW